MESAQRTKPTRLVVKLAIQIRSRVMEGWVVMAEVTAKGNWLNRKGGEATMEHLKRLVLEEDGQGLVEYTLIVLLVALVFWVAIKGTNIGSALTAGWTDISSCVSNPTACGGS